MTVYRTPDQTADIERRRLEHLSALFDTPTIAPASAARGRARLALPRCRRRERLRGARVAALVAPEGEVLATDLDDRFLGEAEPHLEFRVHDITRDELPAERFDLAHARGVLEHVRDREAGIAKMVAAVRPGGLVVVEDPDWLVFDAQAVPKAFGELHRTLRDAYVASAGYDPNLGTRLPELLTDAGLVNVEAEGKVFMMYGGTPSMEWYVLGLERSLGTVIELGLVSADLATAALAEVRDPKCRLLSPLQMTAWGRKPG